MPSVDSLPHGPDGQGWTPPGLGSTDGQGWAPPVSHMAAEAHTLSHIPLLPKGSGSEVEQLGLKHIPVWDPGLESRGHCRASYSTVLASRHGFLLKAAEVASLHVPGNWVMFTTKTQQLSTNNISFC